MSRSAPVFLLLAGCGSPLAPNAPPSSSAERAARVLEPGCAGSPYATIQAAIDAAADRDVVRVCAGTYDERLRIAGKRLTLRSESGAAATVIDAHGIGRALTVVGNAEVTVEGFTFVNGFTAGDGANVSCLNSDLDLLASVLSSGEAGRGGGLGASGCSGSVSDNTFDDNDAGTGGAAWIARSGVLFERNTVSSNRAAGSAGGVYLAGDGDIRDNTFTGNTAGDFAGGLFLLDGFGEIAGNRFDANVALNDGGGAYVYFGSPRVVGNTFDGNESSDEGGGLRVKLSTATVDDNVFVSNHADYRGGGMKVSHEAITMSRNTFTDNTAWVAGGGLAMVESASTLTGNVLRGNTADFGGGLYVLDGWGGVDIIDGVLDGNAANTNGGNLYIELATQVTTLRRVEIRGGTAGAGGGIYAVESVIDIQNGLIAQNVATSSGGGIYLNTTGGEITNTVFWQNDAPHGSAITVVGGIGLDLANSVVSQNTNGAALEVLSGEIPSVRYNDFNLNSDHVAGLPDPIGTNGNRDADPGFRSPATNDFTLLPTSTLIDHGDPAIRDLDGSRCDIGMHGGPGAW